MRNITPKVLLLNASCLAFSKAPCVMSKVKDKQPDKMNIRTGLSDGGPDVGMTRPTAQELVWAMLRMLMGEARQLRRASGGCEEGDSVGGEGGTWEGGKGREKLCSYTVISKKKRKKWNVRNSTLIEMESCFDRLICGLDVVWEGTREDWSIQTYQNLNTVRKNGARNTE